MAHVEDTYVDPQDRFSVGRHTCVERLEGRKCYETGCTHKWFCVTEHLEGGWGEIVSLKVNGKFVEAFETEAEAIEAAEERWPSVQPDPVREAVQALADDLLEMHRETAIDLEQWPSAMALLTLLGRANEA